MTGTEQMHNIPAPGVWSCLHTWERDVERDDMFKKKNVNMCEVHSGDVGTFVRGTTDHMTHCR